MHNPTRMSPLTAFFLGLFGMGAVGLACGAAITVYSLSVIDDSVEKALDFTNETVGGLVQNLPEVLDSLPATVQDILGDRRAPSYASNLDVKVDFTVDDRWGGIRPVMTIVNKGSEVVSMLAVHVAALDGQQLPIREWSEVVATPIALEDNDWRGPLMPGSTRHIVFSRRGSDLSPEWLEKITGATEISEIWVWNPKERT